MFESLCLLGLQPKLLHDSQQLDELARDAHEQAWRVDQGNTQQSKEDDDGKKHTGLLGSVSCDIAAILALGRDIIIVEARIRAPFAARALVAIEASAISAAKAGGGRGIACGVAFVDGFRAVRVPPVGGSQVHGGEVGIAKRHVELLDRPNQDQPTRTAGAWGAEELAPLGVWRAGAERRDR